MVHITIFSCNKFPFYFNTKLIIQMKKKESRFLCVIERQRCDFKVVRCEHTK